MVTYNCFHCGNNVDSGDLKKRFVCEKCGSRVFYKPRIKMKTVSSN